MKKAKCNYIWNAIPLGSISTFKNGGNKLVLAEYHLPVLFLNNAFSRSSWLSSLGMLPTAGVHKDTED